MTKRTLHLKRETLTELGSDELQAVIGGDAVATVPDFQCVFTIVSRQFMTCGCATGNC